jgi:SAM-dependent methyltransferase
MQKKLQKDLNGQRLFDYMKFKRSPDSFYDRDYHKTIHKNLFSNKRYYLARAKISFRRYFSKIPNLDKSKVLEFGSGFGQNIFLLKNRTAYDISGFALSVCRDNHISTINSEKDIPQNYFDIILSCHCLEHLDFPLQNLRLILSKLNEGGKLILIIPKLDHKKVPFLPDKHYELHAWNFRTINNLLYRAGFEVIENRYIYGAMYHKLLFLNKFSFGLYNFLLD